MLCRHIYFSEFLYQDFTLKSNSITVWKNLENYRNVLLFFHRLKEIVNTDYIRKDWTVENMCLKLLLFSFFSCFTKVQNLFWYNNVKLFHGISLMQYKASILSEGFGRYASFLQIILRFYLSFC